MDRLRIWIRPWAMSKPKFKVIINNLENDEIGEEYRREAWGKDFKEGRTDQIQESKNGWISLMKHYYYNDPKTPASEIPQICRFLLSCP